jgi:hypothetical protein
MKVINALAGLALLAACGERQEAAAPEDAATEAMPVEVQTAAGEATTAAMQSVPAGKYDVTMPDGSKMVTEVRADGSYQDWQGDKVVEKGTVAMKGGKTCFDPEGAAAETCFTDGPTGADGSWTATSDKGEKVTVKPQAG